MLYLAWQRQDHVERRDVVPFDLLHLADAMTRPQLGEIAGQPKGFRLYHARPLLLGHRAYFRKNPQGQLALVKSVDLLYNRSEVLSGDPLVAVRQGVLDAHLERLLFEGLEVANTTVVFERTRAAVAVLSPGDTAGLERLGLRSEVKAQIGEDLAAGYAVVIPTEAVRIAGTSHRGPCNACFIMLMGGLGVVLGFAGIVCVLAGRANLSLWILLRFAGGYGAGVKLSDCLRWWLRDYMGEYTPR
ncbi:MAG: hypothetical protein QN120_02880 [Armatimonadota bacterium]|nr:hypothetical protein [Armatimonadota bacterium]